MSIARTCTVYMYMYMYIVIVCDNFSCSSNIVVIHVVPKHNFVCS